MDKVSYALGMSIAHNMMHSGVNIIAFDDFMAGLKATFLGEKPAISYDEAGKVLDEFFSEIEAEQAAVKAEAASKFKEEGEAWLKMNSKKEGVVTLASGLQYKVLEQGKGKKPKASDKVRCHYAGTLVDGTKFDSSYDRNQPAVFGLNQVIAGWTEGLQLMSEGSKFEFYIPYQLGYGAQGAHGAIPPYAALIFTVELLEVL